MTEKLAEQIGRLKKGDDFEFYAGTHRRRARLIELTEKGHLALNLIDVGNRWNTSLENFRKDTLRTIEEGPKTFKRVPSR